MTSVRFDRLFHVLVVLGGAMGLAACAGDDTSERDRQVDAAATDDGGTTADAGPDGAELELCFCDVAACCDRSGDSPVLQSGFECCWSTTCD